MRNDFTPEMIEMVRKGLREELRNAEKRATWTAIRLTIFGIFAGAVISAVIAVVPLLL